MSNRQRTRRRILRTCTLGLGSLLAGCSSERQSDRQSATSQTPSTERTTVTTNTPTQSPTETDTPTSPEEQTTEGDGQRDAPGYKDSHWHGRLFFEIDGELVNFDQSKYYLENIQEDTPETVYFHFHNDVEAHGPNEWSNEKKVITLGHALNLLPGIEYAETSNRPILTYDGTRYDARKSGTSITIKEGTESIDPSNYEVQHGDHYWVQITTGRSNTTSSTKEGTDTGTLLFDINNIRIDFSRSRYQSEKGVEKAFYFANDDHSYQWYKRGDVTLREALNAIPGVTYSFSGGHHLTFDDPERPTYSQRYTPDEISIQRRWTPIESPDTLLQKGDIIWLYVKTDQAPENEH